MRGVRAAPRDNATPALKFSPCRWGVCMCAPERRRPLLRLNALLRTVPMDVLLDGKDVLKWDAYFVDGMEGAEAKSPQVGIACDSRLAHVSYVHQRPFYVLLVPMASATGRDGDGESFWAQQAESPMTIYEWISSLDISQAWDVTALRLSERHRAIQHVSGEVCVWPEPVCETSRVWSGVEIESRPTRRGRRQRPLHEVIEEQDAREEGEAAQENVDEPGSGMSNSVIQRVFAEENHPNHA